METKIEKQKKSKVILTVTLTQAELVKYFKAAYEEIAPTVKLPGFRAGKAPRALIESTVGVTRIMSDGLDRAINFAYQQAMINEKITPIDNPAIKIDKYPNYGQTEEEVANPLIFTAEVTILPEIEIGDYSKLKIEKKESHKVSDQDVEKIILNLQKQRSTFKEIDREAKIGDWVEINFEGTLKKVQIDSMCSKNHPLVLGDKTLIPGFEEEIVGMKKGEKKTFKIKFPKDYHAKEYAGKEAEFTVELINLKEVELPVVDDKFAEDFGQKDVAALKKAIAENLQEEYNKEATIALEGSAIDKILPLVKVEMPDILIEREIDRMVADYDERLHKMGVNLESYLKSTKKSAEDLRKEMRAIAEKNAKIGLMLGKVIAEQKIDHHDPEAGKKAIDHLVKVLTK